MFVRLSERKSFELWSTVSSGHCAQIRACSGFDGAIKIK